MTCQKHKLSHILQLCLVEKSPIYRHFKLTCRPTLRAGLWRTKRQRTLATRPANPTEVKRIPWTAKSKRSKCVQLAIRQLLMVNKLKEKLKRKCTRSKYIGSFRRCCTLDQLQSMRFDDWLTDGQKRKEVISLLYQNGRISKIQLKNYEAIFLPSTSIKIWCKLR